MNPWVILGVVLAWGASLACAWGYRGHIDTQTCNARVEAEQLKTSQQDNEVLQGDVKADASTAKNTNQTTEEHHEKESATSSDGAKAQVVIRTIHDQAPATDCQRVLVPAALDQQLRDGTAGTPSDPPAAGGAAS